MKKILGSLILLVSLSTACFAGNPPFVYDPNRVTAPIIKWYIGEPNMPIFFSFTVWEPDGQNVNVSITGIPQLWLNTPPAQSTDPNDGSKTFFYNGDLRVNDAQIVYLLVTADDRQPGDTRPFNDPNDPSGPLKVEGMILVKAALRNRPPEIRR